MNDTPNLALPYILAAQAQKHVTHNEAIRALDCLVQLSVESRALAAPPATPADGSRYIVAAAATGAWAGKSGNVAAFQDGAWAFFAPRTGWLAWVADEHSVFVYAAGAWAAYAGSGSGTITDLDNLAHAGINATADATNRLSLKSPASLFDNEGAGHQQKINKHAAGDTASVLYQTNYSGRAEMGLTGDDDYHFKVSPDGATWNEALKINRSTGAISLPTGQIAFPATQNPSSGANTLDDYEEGTFTPGLTFGGGSTGLTYASRAGRYVKIGSLVVANFYVNLTAKGSSTGVANINGFPFSIPAEPNGNGLFKYFAGFAGLPGALGLDLQTSTTTANIIALGSTGVATLTDGNFTNASAMYGCALYIVAF